MANRTAATLEQPQLGQNSDRISALPLLYSSELYTVKYDEGHISEVNYVIPHTRTVCEWEYIRDRK